MIYAMVRDMNNQSIHLYNTMGREKQLFTSIEPGKATMYHCGPTVYNYAHIGNLRAYVFADVLRRVMDLNGYEVTQVMNITDIGHLVGDGDAGDDKMTKALVREGMELTLENMLKIGEKYTEAFLEDLNKLNIQKPHHLPRASDHIKEDIDIIEELFKKDLAYKTSDGLYFDTQKDPEYGKLRGESHDHDDGHARLGENSEKKHPYDFALWKFDNEKGWESPWGQGFPGWHIECSGMSMRYLGKHFDIHTGGIDHIPVHHTNEIAQSENAYEGAKVNYWMHNNFLNLSSGKMAKSGEGFITLRTVIEKGIHPLAYRYLLLQSHYRSEVAFSWESLEAAQKGLMSLHEKMQSFGEFGVPDPEKLKDTQYLQTSYIKNIEGAFNDDLNTAKALGELHSMFKDSEIPDAQKFQIAVFADLVLDLGLANRNIYLELQALDTNSASIPMDALPDNIQYIVKKRKQARENKDWKKSDELRDELASKGYEIKDGEDGQEIFGK